MNDLNHFYPDQERRRITIDTEKDAGARGRAGIFY